MESRDVDAVLAIQIASPEAAQWTATDYDIANRPATSGSVAEKGSQIVGFIVARHVLDEIEILNIAVHPDSRRQGVATGLLSAALQRGIDHGARKAYLEVRASNTPAIRFYERHSFHPSGRRARYYSHPVQDAVILVSELRKI
jgi:[ribosomal protein S18]-alanine N-acetyltransferase